MHLTQCAEPLLCAGLSDEFGGPRDEQNRVSAFQSLKLRAEVRKLILRRARSETLWLCGLYSLHHNYQPFHTLRHGPGAVGPSPWRGPGVGLSVGSGSLAVGLRVLLSLSMCAKDRELMAF